MTWIKLVSSLYFFMAAHKAACKNPVEGLLEVYEDMIEVLLALDPRGSLSCGGDVTVHVLGPNQPSLSTLLFCSCVCFCHYSPFNCISFHKFSQQLSTFSLPSPGLNSASLVLSTIYIYISL